MKNGKSPGADGFAAEFYKFFWADLGTYLIKCLNEAFDKGELSVTQKQGIITLLPKGDKPREFLKNWRPNSLLNVIMLLEGAMANRMKKVLPSIINQEQKRFFGKKGI